LLAGSSSVLRAVRLCLAVVVVAIVDGSLLSLRRVKLFESGENSVRPRVDAIGREVAPSDDTISVNYEESSC